MATWIMEDEEQDLELLELLKEARQHIDDTIPRGDAQVQWLWSKIKENPSSLIVWFDAHKIMHELERQLKYGE